MIELNGTKISEEDFEMIAEQHGYKREFEYPLVMLNKHHNDVWEFMGLNLGICLKENDLGVHKAGDKTACLTKHTDTTVWQPCERPVKLYDGLTEEQWQQVIDEELIIQLRDKDCDDWHTAMRLRKLRKQSSSPFGNTLDWKQCRIHPAQPQFGGRVDWVEDLDWVVYTKNGGSPLVEIASGMDWENVTRWQVVKL